MRIPVCKCCSFYRLSAVDMGCTLLIPLITSDDTRKSLSTYSSFISDRKTVRWDRKEHDGLDPGPAKNSTSPNWVCEKRRKKEHDQVENSCIESYQIFTPMCMTYMDSMWMMFKLILLFSVTGMMLRIHGNHPDSWSQVTQLFSGELLQFSQITM